MKKLCLLVGGSRGLGLALYNRYRNSGYEIKEYSRSGDSDDHVSLDLSRRETSIDTIDASFQELADLPWDDVVLILNAAALEPIGPLHMSEPKQWWTHIDINFTLPISILGRFQAQFGQHDSRKVAAFVSSGAAHSALDGWSLYCASKAGVEHFLRTMAVEQFRHPHPIECANLSPGIMDTEMQASIRAANESQTSIVQQFIEFKEQGSLASPEVVAENILNALEGEFVSGETLNVAG